MEGNILDFIIRVNAVLEGLTAHERLEVMNLAWLAVANNARTEALILPGGFPAERSRQVDQLRQMADLVSTDEPDLEMERLYHEGDVEGMARRIRDLRDENDKGDA